MTLKIFQRMWSDLRQRPEATNDLAFARSSWERSLTAARCPPSMYTKVYDLAVEIYRTTDFGKGPFNLYHLLEAWARIQAREQYDRKHPRVEEESRLLTEGKAERCSECNGKKLKMVNGRFIFVVIGGKRVPKPCPACVGEDEDGE